MTRRDYRYEVRIVRAAAPSCYRLAALRRWRWSVTHYHAVDGQNPGVRDTRMHLANDGGYTFTWLGAAIAMARVVAGASASALALQEIIKGLNTPPRSTQ